jgi:hypothetical protein
MNRPWPVRSTIPGKPQKISAKIADIPAEIRTEHLLNMSSHRYRPTSVSQTLGRGPPDSP